MSPRESSATTDATTAAVSPQFGVTDDTTTGRAIPCTSMAHAGAAPSTSRALLHLLILGIALVKCCTADASVLNVGGCPLITGGSCPDPRVRFFLYTPLNPVDPQRIDYGRDTTNLSQSFFNASLPTKILIHGFNANMFIFKNVLRDYLQRGDYNVMLLDWLELCNSPCYISAAHNTGFVGRCLAEMVRRVLEAGATDIHLIGFSLGAHVPGFAANLLRPYLVPRITGLDPALPLFVTTNKDQKLDAGDALFVDVLHTNAFMQGKSEQCGHVDFYMNGGVTQPGCSGDSACNHLRAVQYFAESIRSTAGFWGWPCGDIITYLLGLCPPRGTPRRAGEDVDMMARGFYVVRTNAESPYAQGPWKPAPQERPRRHALAAAPAAPAASATSAAGARTPWKRFHTFRERARNP